MLMLATLRYLIEKSFHSEEIETIPLPRNPWHKRAKILALLEITRLKRLSVSLAVH
jgi:hypothetical protein